jgi:sugar lactone lactonase YvrE
MMRLRSLCQAVFGAALLGLAITPSAALADPINIGDVFAAVNNGMVQHYSQSGNTLSLLETVNTGDGGFTTGMAFDSSRNLYLTGFTSNKVYEAPQSNAASLTPIISSGLSTPESIVFDKAGNFYVSQVSGTGANKYDSGANFQTNLSNMNRSDWLDLAADQKTLYWTDEGTAIHRIDTTTNTVLSDFATGLPGGQAFAFRILPDGGVLIADDTSILRLDSSGNVVQTYTETIDGETTGFFALNIDPDGKSFFTGSFDNDKFYKFDIASGTELGAYDTGMGGGNLFGLAVAGEFTQAISSAPEPASVAMLAGAGFVGLFRYGLRRRKQAR